MAKGQQRNLWMDSDERLPSVYGKVLNALEEALFWLERPLAEGPDVHDAQRSGMFHLGASGGFAFVGHLPGIKSEALFDDVSDATEKWDLDRVGEIRRTVAARLRSDHPPDEPSPGKGGLDWATGYLQMLAVLNEARTAREEGDIVRYSLMAGFLVGLMSEVPWSSGVRYRRFPQARSAGCPRPKPGKRQKLGESRVDHGAGAAGRVSGHRPACTSPAMGGRTPGRGGSTVLPNVYGQGVLRQRGNFHSARAELREEDRRPRWRGSMGSR